MPGVGTFKNGRADLYDYEPIGGRTVKVRFSIWKITEDAMQTEQAFSDDGGKTWEELVQLILAGERGNAGRPCPT